MQDAEFPIYAVVGLAAEPAGFGGGVGKTTHVALRQGGLTVDSSRGDSRGRPPVAAREELARLSNSGARWPQDLDADGPKLWPLARERDAAQHAAPAPVTTTDLDVAGARTTFHVASTQDQWAAVADLDGVRVTITGEGEAPPRELAFARWTAAAPPDQQRGWTAAAPPDQQRGRTAAEPPDWQRGGTAAAPPDQGHGGGSPALTTGSAPGSARGG